MIYCITVYDINMMDSKKSKKINSGHKSTQNQTKWIDTNVIVKLIFKDIF
jgi:hypothetical protein